MNRIVPRVKTHTTELVCPGRDSREDQDVTTVDSNHQIEKVLITKKSMVTTYGVSGDDGTVDS